jgi:hypothetical protein
MAFGGNTQRRPIGRADATDSHRASCQVLLPHPHRPAYGVPAPIRPYVRVLVPCGYVQQAGATYQIHAQVQVLADPVNPTPGVPHPFVTPFIITLPRSWWHVGTLGRLRPWARLYPQAHILPSLPARGGGGGVSIHQYPSDNHNVQVLVACGYVAQAAPMCQDNAAGPCSLTISGPPPPAMPLYHPPDNHNVQVLVAGGYVGQAEPVHQVHAQAQVLTQLHVKRLCAGVLFAEGCK